MNYKELKEALASARPASFAADSRPESFAASSRPASSAGLSRRDAALIKGIAPAVHEYVQREIAGATSPHLKRIDELERRVANLESLVASYRASLHERRGHGDARGPTSSSAWRQ
jgi:hypothetical protein